MCYNTLGGFFMAKKGSKFNHYTPEFKTKVVETYLSGEFGGSKKLAKHFGIPSSWTIDSWVNKYKKYGPEAFSVESRGRSSKGRRKKINFEEMTKDEQIAYLRMENDILKIVKALRKR